MVRRRETEEEVEGRELKVEGVEEHVLFVLDSERLHLR